MQTLTIADLPHRVVPVLGMHRSGLNLLARMLQALGVDELGGARQGSAADRAPAEFFVQVNRRLLVATGSDADGFDSDKRLRAAANALAGFAPAMESAISAFLSQSVPGGIWGFKDPRTAATLPFWLAVLSRLGIDDVRPIVVVRSPRACLHSLLRSGSLQRLSARPDDLQRFVYTLWSTYYALIEAHGPPDTLWLLQQDLISPDLAPAVLAHVVGALGLREVQISPALAMVDSRLLRDPGEAEEATGLLQLDRHYQRLWARARPPNVPARAHARAVAPKSPGAVLSAEAARHCVYVVSPQGYRHSRAFDEVALTLHHALCDLHIRAPIVTEPSEISGTPIVLGAHLLSRETAAALPAASIVYNLEQVSPGSPWFSDAYLATLRRFSLWDYSKRNLHALGDLGIEHGQYCELGYHPALATLTPLPEAERDIDVLFYGSLNPRRAELLAILTAAGLRVVHLFGIYGVARDRYIARARVVLSLHYYEAHILEIVRIAHLMANGCCIVAEAEAVPELSPELRAGLRLTDYAGLVDACCTLVAAVAERKALAATAWKCFSQRPQAAILARLLEHRTR